MHIYSRLIQIVLNTYIKCTHGMGRRISKPTAYIVDVDWKKVQTEYGPPIKERLSEDETKRVLAENGFSLIKQIDIGPYHYELIYKPTLDCQNSQPQTWMATSLGSQATKFSCRCF